ncbi:unnamed protein product [Protopolystoma xenopodis]|uniref:Uncharacterized protein n=1 Tax=Protopolystoma xenopodis TaxID=117903 RepID=A0A448WED0_9PLAT|nr:unnamed protein product [Protopolystoma xenopodis]
MPLGNATSSLPSLPQSTEPEVHTIAESICTPGTDNGGYNETETIPKSRGSCIGNLNFSRSSERPAPSSKDLVSPISLTAALAPEQHICGPPSWPTVQQPPFVHDGLCFCPVHRNLSPPLPPPPTQPPPSAEQPLLNPVHSHLLSPNGVRQVAFQMQEIREVTLTRPQTGLRFGIKMEATGQGFMNVHI